MEKICCRHEKRKKEVVLMRWEVGNNKNLGEKPKGFHLGK